MWGRASRLATDLPTPKALHADLCEETAGILRPPKDRGLRMTGLGFSPSTTCHLPFFLLTIAQNCGDSSAPKGRGPQNDRPWFFPTYHIPPTTYLSPTRMWYVVCGRWGRASRLATKLPTPKALRADLCEETAGILRPPKDGGLRMTGPGFSPHTTYHLPHTTYGSSPHTTCHIPHTVLHSFPISRWETLVLYPSPTRA
jgi:hypothetical protein